MPGRAARRLHLQSAGDAGSHTFSATLKTAGEQSITATDTADGLDHRQPDRHHRHPGRDRQPDVAGFAASTTAGVSQSFTVTAKDAYGNTATGYTGTVHFTSSDVQARPARRTTPSRR